MSNAVNLCASSSRAGDFIGDTQISDEKPCEAIENEADSQEDNLEEFSYMLRNFERDFPKFSEAFRAYGAPRLGESQLFDLELSLEELIVNSFSHGNSGGPVLVHVCMDGKDARVTIEDSAPPFNLLRESPEPPQGPPAQRKAGGWVSIWSKT